MYSSQKAFVATDKQSREFHIARGTKQGDPISPVLFNAVLEYMFGPLKRKWHRRGLGLNIGIEENLTNLRFADDVLLVTSSLEDLKTMLSDLQHAAGTIGLEIHYGKTKILANEFGHAEGSPLQVKIEGPAVGVLRPDEDTMYLGRALQLNEYHEREIRHRISKAWKKFAVHRKTLCDKHCALNHRLRLFAATVTPTVLYGACTWTMSQEAEAELRGVQRKMLRQMVGSPRKIIQCEKESDTSGSEGAVDNSSTDDGEQQFELETWVDWIQRVTRTAVEELGKLGLKEWVLEQRQRKFDWAQKVAKMDDHRWAKALLLWKPDGTRKVGHPKLRWDDCFVELFAGQDAQSAQDWIIYAHDNDTWNAAARRFCKD